MTHLRHGLFVSKEILELSWAWCT